MGAYYNENDPNAAAWLRELIARDLIAPGDVDDRSIVDVRADDLRGYAQCHFFAGIGVWSHALRGAGWPDERPIWTGSCPCQPFSAAGRGDGFNDPRHLWPDFFRLIRECRPDTVAGEQVASKDGLAWFDLVSSDLEGSGYAVGAVDTPAAGFGAPHVRQRLYWVGITDHAFRRSDMACGHLGDRADAGRTQTAGDARPRRGSGGLVAASRVRAGGRAPRHHDDSAVAHDAAPIRLADDHGDRSRQAVGGLSGGDTGAHGSPVRPGPVNGFWSAADWLSGRDGRWRPAEPGTFPLAHGSAARVGRLRGYGNGLVAPQAQAFCEVLMEVAA